MVFAGGLDSKMALPSSVISMGKGQWGRIGGKTWTSCFPELYDTFGPQQYFFWIPSMDLYMKRKNWHLAFLCSADTIKLYQYRNNRIGLWTREALHLEQQPWAGTSLFLIEEYHEALRLQENEYFFEHIWGTH